MLISIVVRYNPPSLTTEQYEEADRLLREAGVEPLPEGLECHVCFGPEGNLRVSEIWDSRERFEAYSKQLKRVAGDGRHPFRFWRSSKIFKVHRIGKR